MEKNIFVFLFFAIIVNISCTILKDTRPLSSDIDNNLNSTQGKTDQLPTKPNFDIDQFLIQECIRICPTTSEYNPLCGTDNKTYSNPGKLKCAQMCGVDVKLQRWFRCPTTTTQAPETTTKLSLTTTRATSTTILVSNTTTNASTTTTQAPVTTTKASSTTPIVFNTTATASSTTTITPTTRQATETNQNTSATTTEANKNTL